MKRRRLMIGVVIAAPIAVFLAQLVLDLSPLPFESISSAVVSLLTLWAMLGRPSSPWRLIGVAAGTYVTVWSLHETSWLLIDVPLFEDLGWRLDAVDYYMYLTLGQIVSLAVPLLLVRSCGVRLASTLATDTPNELATTSAKPQFSIRSMLEWTLAAAVCFAIIRHLAENTHGSLRPWGWIAFHGLPMLLALSAFWLTLGATRLPLRAAVFALVLTLLISQGVWLDYCLKNTSWLLGSLGLIRLSGYRLASRRRTRQLADHCSTDLRNGGGAERT